MKLIEMEDGITLKKVSDEDAQDLVDSGRARYVERSQIREYESMNYRPYRNIFTTIKADIFADFCHQAYEEGFLDETGRTDIKTALAILVEKYARGEIPLKQKKEKKEKQKSDYQKDHEQAAPEPENK